MINKLIKSVLTLGLLGILGCTPIQTKTEVSEVKHDLATVYKERIPASTNDFMVLFDDIPIPFNYANPEKNLVRFNGETTRFEVDNLELYNKFEDEDVADVSYQEVTRTRTEVLTRNGMVTLNKKLPAGYQFVDAKLFERR